jgi:hypothetical protein
MWWFIGVDVVVHWMDVVAHWFVCSGSLEWMWWLVGVDVVVRCCGFGGLVMSM